MSQQWKAAKECLILESTLARGQEGQGKQGKQVKQGKQGKSNGKVLNFPNTDLHRMKIWKWATENMKSYFNSHKKNLMTCKRIR